MVLGKDKIFQVEFPAFVMYIIYIPSYASNDQLHTFLSLKKSSQFLTMHFKPAKKNDCRGWKAVLSSIRLLILSAQLWNCRFQEEDKNRSQNL